MNHIEAKKTYQLRALELKLREGKTKNKYALQNKINKLREEIASLQKQSSWNKFLSQ